jgi:hypothetical protein
MEMLHFYGLLIAYFYRAITAIGIVQNSVVAEELGPLLSAFHIDIAPTTVKKEIHFSFKSWAAAYSSFHVSANQVRNHPQRKSFFESSWEKPCTN